MRLMKLLRGRTLALGLLALATMAVPTAAFADDDADDEEEVDAEDYGSSADDSGVEDTDPSAVVIYRSKLAPYGRWVDHPSYGTVWVPSSDVVGADFAPYVSSGRWELTDDGDWLWVSEYDWGYIPFHYGRWVWVSGVGWAWIPGRTYSNAWVVWRVGSGGYIGWAPMPPAYYWSDGYAVAIWAVPPAPFIFVHSHYVFHHHVHTYVVHDHAEVRRAADATHHHHGHATAHHTSASPSLKEAGIDPKDAPKNRSKADPRALELRHSDKDRPSKGSGAALKSKANASASRSGGATRGEITRSGGPGSASVGKGGDRTTATKGSSPKARRVSPIVGQRVEAARGEARRAPSTNARPSTGATTRGRPSVEGPSSVPRPSPSIPRAQPAPQQTVKKRVAPPQTTGAPVQRSAPRSTRRH